MTSRYEIFLKVAESGSFTRAARELGYSQPAVSQAVRSLEKELGTVLLVRSNDGIIVTGDGRSYLPYIRGIVTAEREFERKKQRMLGFEDSVIRIGTFTSVSRNILPPLMRNFRARYPGVSFELLQGEYDAIRTWTEEGRVDFGFYGLSDCRSLAREEIYHDAMAAVLPKNHPLAVQDKVAFRDLEKLPFILLDEGRDSIPEKTFAAHGMHLAWAYKVYDDYTILTMIRQGMGVSILYELVVAGFAYDLVLKPLEEPIERTISLIRRERAMLSSASLAFYDYVRSEAGRIAEESRRRMTDTLK